MMRGAIPIDNEAAYSDAIRRRTSTECMPERCPRCGLMVGKAIKASGTTYLAELWTSRQGTSYADKRRPHFVNCTGTPAPGVIAKGVKVRVARGRKVPIGTEGVVIWIGNGDFGERVGIKDATGAAHFTAAKNVEVIQ
jgi:hypothetical protein